MKEWIKPKLISLYRGRPQEAVLLGCKLDGALGTGQPSPGGEGAPPDDQWVDCMGLVTDPEQCRLIGES